MDVCFKHYFVSSVREPLYLIDGILYASVFYVPEAAA